MTEAETNPRDLILDLFSRIVRHAGGVSCIDLNSAEAAFCRVMWLEASVDNGGLVAFFSSSYGDFAPETLEALSQIGARDAASILREAISLFGAAGPPRDQAARTQALDRLGPGTEAQLSRLDEAFYAQEEALDRLKLAFLRSAGLVRPGADA